MYKSIIVILFFIVSQGYGQNTLSTSDIDKKTYELYLNGEWKKLIEVGEKATIDSIHFYYLDVRMGVAYFYTQSYINAKIRLKKARDSYSQNNLVNELLFWSNYYTGNNFEANNDLSYLPDSIQKRINIKPLSSNNFWYNEAGIKKSKNNVNEGTYLNSTLGVQIKKRFQLTTGVTNLKQSKNWGSYTQNQLYSALNYQINPIFSVFGSFQGINNNTIFNTDNYNSSEQYNYDYSYNNVMYDVIEDDSLSLDYSGNLTQKANLFSLGFTTKLNRIILTPQITVFTEKLQSTFNYTQQNDITKRTYLQANDSLLITSKEESDSSYSTSSDSSSVQYQPELFFGFQPDIFKDKLFLGINLIVPVSTAIEETKLMVVPSFSYQLRRNIFFNGSYFQKKNHFFAQNGGALFYNSTDEVSKLSLTLNYRYKKHIEANFTFQNASVKDAYDDSNYSLTSILFGIKIKL